MPSKDKLQFALRLPGLLLAFVVAALAMTLSRTVLPGVGGVALAIFLGIAVGNLVSLGAKMEPGLVYAEKSVLAAAIILYGAQLRLDVLGELGASSLLVVICAMLLAMFLGRFAAPLVKVAPKLGLLVGIGSAVCGSSAIAAAAPLVTKDREQVGVAVGVVNLLGTLGIVLVPFLAGLLDFDSTAAGLLAGGSLQAVGHVVAAGFAIGPETAELALAIKMGRVAMLVPLVLVLSAMLSSKAPEEVAAKGSKKKLPLPGYLIGFVVLAAIANAGWIPAEWLGPLKTLSKWLLATAMAGIGLRIRFKAFARMGGGALVLGLIVFLAQLSLLASAGYFFPG